MAGPFSAEAVSTLIEQQLPDPFPLSIRLIVPPAEAELLSHKGPAFRLWLVAEAIDGAHRDSKVVFDDITGQFGVANETNVFLGFCGTFGQTLAVVQALLSSES